MKILSTTAGAAALAVLASTVYAPPASARRLNFMDGNGYQTQLAQSRKAYADAWAQYYQRPQVTPRQVRKQKTKRN